MAMQAAHTKQGALSFGTRPRMDGKSCLFTPHRTSNKEWLPSLGASVTISPASLPIPAKKRQMSEEVAEWKAEDPDVPDGDWYKDFGKFKLSGTGGYPS